MQVYINKEEIQAISNAYEEVQSRLECCDDEESISHLKGIQKSLLSIERKYFKPPTNERTTNTKRFMRLSSV